MTARVSKKPAPSSGPRLGVSRQQRVRTAGGRVGQWWTPAWCAESFVSWADLDGAYRVLDAGAGMGALSLAAFERHDHLDVIMVERDERLVAHLEQLDPVLTGDARVRHADFLERDVRQVELFDRDARRGFDVVMSNPPWERDLPERFILRGLELAPRVCAIVPLAMLCGGARAGFWRSVNLARAKALPNRPKFNGAGNGMRDVMFIEVRDGASRGAALEVG